MAVIVRVVSPELCFRLAMSRSCPIASTCLILRYSTVRGACCSSVCLGGGGEVSVYCDFSLFEKPALYT